MVRNNRSALMALAAAGGLWAWRNRDKIQGWLNSQRSQLESQYGGNQQFGSDLPATGQTQRINIDTDAQFQDERHRREI